MSIINYDELIIDNRIKNKVSNTIKKYKSPLFLVGPHGIGKTTIILTIANKLKYQVIKINPDNDYKKNKKSIFVKKQIILLDNLEEIKGKKLTEMVNYFIKDGRILMMVTAEVHQDLTRLKKKHNIRATNYSFDNQKWIEYLKKKYQNKKIEDLVHYTKRNKGLALNQLNFGIDEIGEKINKNLTIWEIFENTFNKDIDRYNFYYQENILPLFIWENYPRLKDNSLEYCVNSASACAITDMMEHIYKSRQRYELMPYVSIMALEMCTYNYNERIFRPRFPEYFSKTKSSEKKELTLEYYIKKNRKKK